MKKVIKTDKAPKAIGPYNQAILVNGMLFASGQIALSPNDGILVGTTIEEQTKQVFENICAILDEAQMSFENVVKTTVFLSDMSNFQSMNEIYALYFSSDAPARSTVAVKDLPKGALVEIEIIAIK